MKRKYLGQLFQLTELTNVRTNNMAQDSLDAVQEEHGFMWKNEEFHCEIKQVTGIEKCKRRI